MRRIATEVGYSETAFAMPQGDAWRVRYFSPESEVPFCGHATIALGAALALAHGNGVYRLHLNSADITVSGECHGGQLSAVCSVTSRMISTWIFRRRGCTGAPTTLHCASIHGQRLRQCTTNSMPGAN
jgi:predicted PhzF superfamily epimerase YddE/YHI9